jgi:hypothetical protein
LETRWKQVHETPEELHAVRGSPESSEESTKEEEDKDQPSEGEEESHSAEEDVPIPTLSEEREDQETAEVVSALTITPRNATLSPLPTLPTFLTTLGALADKGKKKEDDTDPRPSGSARRTMAEHNAMKLKSPPTFTGKRSELNSFLNKCNLFMEYHKTDSHKEKILFVMYLLDGPVAQWRNNKKKEYDATPAKYVDYNAFITELKADWGHVDEASTALHRLLNYKKLKRTPINQYVARVENDLSIAEITDDATMAQMLLLGLPNDLKMKLRLGGIPKGYKAFKQRLLDLEVATILFAETPRAFNDPDAMQVDRVKIRESTMDWVSTAKCYGCGEVGHIVADCPNPKKSKRSNGNSRFKGKSRRKFKGKFKGKGKGRRIRALDADESENDESEDNSEEEEENDDDNQERVMLIQELARALPSNARKMLKKQGF